MLIISFFYYKITAFSSCRFEWQIMVTDKQPPQYAQRHWLFDIAQEGQTGTDFGGGAEDGIGCVFGGGGVIDRQQLFLARFLVERLDMRGQVLYLRLVEPVGKSVLNHIQCLCVVERVWLHRVEERILNTLHPKGQPTAVAGAKVQEMIDV